MIPHDVAEGATLAATPRRKKDARPAPIGSAEPPPAISPAQKFISDRHARAVLTVSEDQVVNRRVNEIADMLFSYEGMTEAEKHTRVVRAIELYNGLAPADGLEGMLAEQMVGTHSAALECLRRAAHTNQTFEGRDMALKHATKLMELYAKQVAALDKHRGKGQQKVTVEHVHVEAGGQAIVGNVETRSTGRTATAPSTRSKRDAPAETTEPPASIEHRTEVPLDQSPPRRRARTRRDG